MTIDVSSESEVKADELIKAGFKFECEILANGFVYADCCDKEGQLFNVMCMNGPEVPAKIEQLVTQAYIAWITLGRPLANSGWAENSYGVI